MSATSLPRAWLLLGLCTGAFVAAGCGSSTDSDEPSGSAGSGAAAAGSGAAGAGSGAAGAGSGVAGAGSGVAGAGQAGSGGALSGAGGALSGAGGAGSAVSGSGGAISGSGGAISGSGGTQAGGSNGTSGASFGGSAGSAMAGASSSAGSANGGSAGANGGSAGANGGSAGASGGSAGAGGTTTNTDYLKTRANSYGFVDIAASSKNQILSLSTTLTVPAKPKANTGTLFLWPGLQPGGANYDPIDNGVLQPVLTWGGTCAPNAPNSYASWWISGQYVNTYGSDPGYTGCLGGPGMNVAVGDALQMVMSLNGTIWHQVVTDAATNKSVSFDLDMLGQAQNYAEFVIEQYTQDPATDVIFTATTIVFDKAEAASCQPIVRGTNDFFTNPQASSDGKQCTIDRIVLRAQGIAATSPN